MVHEEAHGRDGDRAAASRLQALEERIAHQDATIADLDAAVTAQWARIEALTRLVARLDDQLQEAEARSRTAGPQAPPPHY